MRAGSLTVTEAVRNFSEYINRVFYRHESFILYKGKNAVAELKPIPAGRRLGDLPGILESLPRLSADEADAFLSDIDEAREAIDKVPVGNPWES